MVKYMLVKRISIPVKNVAVNCSNKTFLAMIMFALTSGVLMGFFLAGNIALALPLNLRSTLGAVGGAMIGGETEVSTRIQSADTVSNLTIKTESPRTARVTPAVIDPVFADLPRNFPTVSKDKAILKDTIQEKALRIEDISQRIQQLKNESVSLVAEFDSNCGNWQDECAIEYKNVLEKNNELYEQLLATRTTLYEEHANAERLLVSTE